jgi:hypothetical protein
LTSTLLLDKGGTGSKTGLHNASHGAVIIKNSGGYLAPVSSAKGAFYATAANGTPLFGTLPIAQGGTGATTAEAALTNLGGLPLSGGEISGNLKVKTLTITDQSAGGISHIKFSRETYNYIEVPSTARLIFLP